MPSPTQSLMVTADQLLLREQLHLARRQLVGPLQHSTLTNQPSRSAKTIQNQQVQGWGLDLNIKRSKNRQHASLNQGLCRHLIKVWEEREVMERNKVVPACEGEVGLVAPVVMSMMMVVGHPAWLHRTLLQPGSSSDGPFASSPCSDVLRLPSSGSSSSSGDFFAASPQVEGETVQGNDGCTFPGST